MGLTRLQLFRIGRAKAPIDGFGYRKQAACMMQDTFRDIGASDEMVQALLSMGIGRPSHIQAAAYRALAEDSSYVVLADHAGLLHISERSLIAAYLPRP